jgi:hypothetical protein
MNEQTIEMIDQFFALVDTDTAAPPAPAAPAAPCESPPKPRRTGRQLPTGQPLRDIDAHRAARARVRNLKPTPRPVAPPTPIQPGAPTHPVDAPELPPLDDIEVADVTGSIYDGQMRYVKTLDVVGRVFLVEWEPLIVTEPVSALFRRDVVDRLCDETLRDLKTVMRGQVAISGIMFGADVNNIREWCEYAHPDEPFAAFMRIGNHGSQRANGRALLADVRNHARPAIARVIDDVAHVLTRTEHTAFAKWWRHEQIVPTQPLPRLPRS